MTELHELVLQRHAVRAVLHTQLGSTRMLMRNLKVGHDTANELMRVLEEQGIVGPAKEGRARDVLHTADHLDDVLAKQFPMPGEAT